MSLSPFENHEVRASKLALSAADTPLSAALEVDPIELPLGYIGQVVLEFQVGEIKFKPMKEGDDLVRIAGLKVLRAAIVPGDSPVGAGTLGLLNTVTEKQAEAGTAPGAIPGQTTLDGAGDEGADSDQAVVDAIEADDQWEDQSPPPSVGAGR
jgi:hypothetical protein